MSKNTRVTRNISSAHFWGQFVGLTNLKLSGWMSYSNSQIMESCCFRKKNYQIWFCLLHLHFSIIKVKIISKFGLATNNVMYVHIVSGLYQGCPAIWNKKKVNTKSNKDKSTLIILKLNGLRLYMCFVWKMKRFIDTLYSMLEIW